MNYQFITGVLLARETPVLLDGSFVNALFLTAERSEWTDRRETEGRTRT